MSHRLFAVSCLACLAAAACGFAAEPNETFGQASVLAPGVLTTGGQSFEDGGLGVTYADTTLGFFSDKTFTELIDENDDFLLLGDGHGSALDILPVNPDGSVPLAVSGYNDRNFDGANDDDLQLHAQEGNVELILLIWDNENPLETIDTRQRDIALAPGEVSLFEFADESWIGHFFTAIVDNTIDGGNDVDYWRFTGLPPGARITAETSSETEFQDTFMALYDPTTGELLDENEDANPDTYLSAISTTVPDVGEVVFGVTSFDDFELIGAHGGKGDYTLTVSYDGDTDRDNDVDGDDLMNMLLGAGTPEPSREDGDADRDGDVDRDDLIVWQINAGFGLAPAEAPGQTGAIPEPSSLTLAAALIALCWAGRFTRSAHHRVRGRATAGSCGKA
jgi:hypothetical protein